MRGQYHVVHTSQRGIIRQRLVVEHVQNRGEPAGLQRFDHRLFLNQPGASAVDERGSVLDHRELLPAHLEQVLRVHPHQTVDDVRLREHFLERRLLCPEFRQRFS
ncbi:hypothetical protein SDC9_170581 [bioreactor metagenome]|uniref:Uncharacterized protein n=1 Tax=bioreactor metagenome TaxID=1076179 RepID=A0A645GHH0_9ZZZZ